MSSLEKKESFDLNHEMIVEIDQIASDWEKRKNNIPFLVMHINDLLAHPGSKNDLPQIISMLTDRLPPDDHEVQKFRYCLDKLVDQYDAVHQNYEHYKYRQNEFIQDYFSHKPLGEIKLIASQNSLIIRCYDRLDFTAIVKGPQASPEDVADSTRIVGAYLTSSRPVTNQTQKNLPPLTGCVVVENYFVPPPPKKPSIVGTIHKYLTKPVKSSYRTSDRKVYQDQKFQTTILHERQHQWTDFFSGLNQPKSNYIKKITQELISDPDPIAAKSNFVRRYIRHQISQNIKKHAKNEMLSYFSERQNYQSLMKRLDYDFEQTFIKNPDYFVDACMQKITTIFDQNEAYLDIDPAIDRQDVQKMVNDQFQKIYSSKLRDQILSARLSLNELTKTYSLKRQEAIGKVIDKDIDKWPKIRI